MMNVSVSLTKEDVINALRESEFDVNDLHDIINGVLAGGAMTDDLTLLHMLLGDNKDVLSYDYVNPLMYQIGTMIAPPMKRVK
jgi:hypothetical protein